MRDRLPTAAVERLPAGEPEIGRAILSDPINATIGFERVALGTDSTSGSLMRMLSPTGNPTDRKLSSVLQRVQEAAGIHLAVAAEC